MQNTSCSLFCVVPLWPWGLFKLYSLMKHMWKWYKIIQKDIRKIYYYSGRWRMESQPGKYIRTCILFDRCSYAWQRWSSVHKTWNNWLFTFIYLYVYHCAIKKPYSEKAWGFFMHSLSFPSSCFHLGGTTSESFGVRQAFYAPSSLRKGIVESTFEMEGSNGKVIDNVYTVFF